MSPASEGSYGLADVVPSVAVTRGQDDDLILVLAEEDLVRDAVRERAAYAEVEGWVCAWVLEDRGKDALNPRGRLSMKTRALRTVPVLCLLEVGFRCREDKEGFTDERGAAREPLPTNRAVAFDLNEPPFEQGAFLVGHERLGLEAFHRRTARS